ADTTDVIWFDDAPPAGAVLGSDGGDRWAWAAADPAPYSGALQFQSVAAAGEHQNYFFNATAPLSVAAGDVLVAYVYLDPAAMPSEVMLQWYAGYSWDHRAYWGADAIVWGSGGTVSRRFMGALPAAGGW